MIIKEHIEAGHYPKNEAGRYLVPLRGGNNAIIYVTSHTTGWPIAGAVPDAGSIDGWSLRCWKADGAISDTPCGEDLMWPSPRKVKVKGTITFDEHGREKVAGISYSPGLRLDQPRPVIVFTGEYEEPWS